jgi:tRNA A-37 threonylcarbamoyl transferase component Bud32
MAGAIVWHAGERGVQQRVAAWLADPEGGPAEPIQEDARRVLHRVGDREPDPDRSDARGPWAVKRHRSASGRHPWREGAKRPLGRSPARREWRALSRLHACGVPVPRPLAWGRLANGDEIVVSQWCEGVGLTPALADASEARRGEILEWLASAIDALHDAGYRHGDLHHDNLLVARDRVTLLDLQRARRRGMASERLDDLAQLDLSLARQGVAATFRLDLRRRLGVEAELDGALREWLRDHLRGRSRRVLRVGRRWIAWRAASGRSASGKGARAGQLDDSFASADLVACLDACARETPADERRGGRSRIFTLSLGERRVVVKQDEAGSLRRALADGLRGSPARRAFERGQRLALVSRWAPRPLAWIEERSSGLPRRSWLVLEAVGERDLDRFEARSPREAEDCMRALGAWLAECHAWGLRHRDLKASNLRIARLDPGFRFWWLDLEDLELGREPRDAARLRALAQLNASLADELFSSSARRAGFDAYHARLPFDADARGVMQRVVGQSLDRAHHWRGEDCELAGARRS